MNISEMEIDLLLAGLREFTATLPKQIPSLTCPACQSTSVVISGKVMDCSDCHKAFNKDTRKEVKPKQVYRQRFLRMGQPHRNLDQYDGTYIG